MELECVGAVAMSYFVFKTFWQIDDLDGLEGTLLYALTATNAQEEINGQTSSKNFFSKTTA